MADWVDKQAQRMMIKIRKYGSDESWLSAYLAKMLRDTVEQERERLQGPIRDVIHLAQVSFDGDPYYAEQAELDGDAILDKARAAIAGDVGGQHENN